AALERERGELSVLLEAGFDREPREGGASSCVVGRFAQVARGACVARIGESNTRHLGADALLNASLEKRMAYGRVPIDRPRIRAVRPQNLGNRSLVAGAHHVLRIIGQARVVP